MLFCICFFFFFFQIEIEILLDKISNNPKDISILVVYKKLKIKKKIEEKIVFILNLGDLNKINNKKFFAVVSEGRIKS